MRIRGILTVLLVVLCGGCYSFPVTSPVERIEASIDPERNHDGIEVAAQSPVDGASPQGIIEGFFAAQESYADGYHVARQFLTTQAAAKWKPETEATVYDSNAQTLVIGADGGAVLQATLIGQVDADGVYTAVHDEAFTHDFKLVREDGQWRISNPPAGVLMGSQRFHRAFTAVPTYFFDATGTRLVAQPVYVHLADIDAGAAEVLVRALIRGPRAWLRSAVMDALPAEITSNGTRIDEDGIAHVNLGGSVEALSAEQRDMAATQLLATLSYLVSVRGLTITANGRELSVDIADSQNVVRSSTIMDLRKARDPLSKDLFAVAEGRVLRVSQSGPQIADQLPGEIGQGWVSRPERLGVDWAGETLAITTDNGTKLHVVNTGGGSPTLIHEGTSMLRPQYDVAGGLWTLDNTASGPVMARIIGGQSFSVPLTELAGRKVIAYRISPDLTRLALVVETQGAQEFGMMRIGVDRLTIDGWRPIPVNSRNGLLTTMRDVSFSGSDKVLLVAANAKDPQIAVHSFDLDAAEVGFQGPVSDVEVTAMATLASPLAPYTAVLTSEGVVMRYEAQYRWPTVLDKVTEIAYPS